MDRIGLRGYHQARWQEVRFENIAYIMKSLVKMEGHIHYLQNCMEKF